MCLLAGEYILSQKALSPHPILPWWQVLRLNAERGLPQAKQHLGFISYRHGHDSPLECISGMQYLSATPAAYRQGGAGRVKLGWVGMDFAAGSCKGCPGSGSWRGHLRASVFSVGQVLQAAVIFW